VPVAAAGLAHVLVRDAGEAVRRRVGQHLLARAEKLLLNAAALVELDAHVGGARGQ
jgi:hypothetical protein